MKREREKYEFDHSVNVAGSAGLDESASSRVVAGKKDKTIELRNMEP